MALCSKVRPDGEEIINTAAIFERERYVVLPALLQRAYALAILSVRLQDRPGRQDAISGDQQVPARPASVEIS